MSSFAKFVTGIPVLGPFAVKVKKAIFGKKKFPGSAEYWEERYATGGNSGAGSYSNLAEHKADVINAFVDENGIQTVIEFGCGDGNQLKLGKYPHYIGLDVSPTIIRKCMAMFEDDKTKSFFVYDSRAFRDRQNVFKVELSMSLDVLYHLIEDEIYTKYMNHLFDAGSKYVLIYSSNFQRPQDHHEIDRVFTDWVAKNRPEWELFQKIDNKFKVDPNDPVHSSKADFYFYRKKA
jgi:hypothetical protein